jgi:hypothetical protein
MKIKNILFATALIILTSATLTAQNIMSYKLNMPEIILGDGGKVFIEPLTTNSADAGDSSLGTQYKNAFTSALSKERWGISNSKGTYNPWYTTNIYQLTDVKEEADYIISGDYEYIKNSNKSFTEDTTTDKWNNIPIVYYRYSANSKTQVKGKILVTDTKANKIIHNFPFTTTKSDSKTLIMKEPSVKSTTALRKEANNVAINTYQYKFSPYLAEIKYHFPRIKADNKDLRKEFKSSWKTLKDQAEVGDIKAIAQTLRQLQAKEDSDNIHEGLGICYELIGNYTKAKEEYMASKNKDCVNRINAQIITRDALAKLGVTITEPEL